MPRPSVRGKLLEASLDVFHAQGFNGCSIQDIAEAAGVPKGSFFNHFASKEAAAIEVLAPYGATSRIDMLFDARKRPLERLKGHFSYLADVYESYGFERGCLLGNFGVEMAAAHPQMRAALRGIFEQWAGAVATVLREAQDAGELGPDINPDHAASFLVNAWEGVAMRLKVTRDRQAVEEFFEICFDHLLSQK